MVSKSALVALAVGAIFTIVIFGLSPPITLQYQLLSNTDQCLVDCSLKFRFRINRDRTIWLPNDVAAKFVKAKYAGDLQDWGLRILEPVTFNITVPDYGNCTGWYELIDNVTGEVTNVSYNYSCIIGYHQEQRTEDRWVDWDTFGYRIDANKWYYVELWGKKFPKLGPNNIDARPTIFGRELPFAWWNSSYSYRYLIKSNATLTDLPLSVNDTTGVGGNFYWYLNASQGENVYVYCEQSGCSSGLVAIANQTDEKDWEKEINGTTGNNPQNIYSNWKMVYHFHEGFTDSANTSRSVTQYPTSYNWVSGKFGKSFQYGGGSLHVQNPEVSWGEGFVAFWAYLPSGGNGCCQLGDYNSPWDWWNIQRKVADPTKIEVWDSTTLILSSTNPLPYNDNWHFIVVRWNSSATEIWINNTLDASTSGFDGGTDNNDFNIQFANTTSGDYRLDQLMVVNSYFKDSYIDELYKNGRNQLISLGSEESYAPPDTCTPGVNWMMDCSDNCTKTNEAITTGNWTIYGSNGYFLCDGCNLSVESMRMNATDCKLIFTGNFKYVVGD